MNVDFSKSKSARNFKNYRILIVLSVIVSLFSSFGMYIYERNSQWIYFWDNAAYWDQVYNLSRSLRESGHSFFATFSQQINTEYPTWWALPFALIPTELLLTRAGYTIPLTALSTLLIFIASNLLFKHYKMDKTSSFLFSSALTFSPPVWIVLTGSHPDLISISVILIGIVIALKAQGNLGYLLLSILVIMFAIALRKTEAFAAAAAILSIICSTGIQSLRDKNHLQFRNKGLILFSLVGMFMIPVLSPGIVSTLFRDNSEFYKSWRINPSEVVTRIIATNGWLIVGFYLVTIFIFLRTKKFERKIQNIWIVILPVGVFIAFITLAPAEAPIHMAQLGVLLLVSGFTVISIFNSTPQALVGTVALVTSLVLTFHSTLPIDSLNSKLMPMDIQPLKRSDIKDLLEIKKILLRDGGKDNNRDIYVAGTSGVINPDLVYRLTRPDFNVVPAGDVDFRDAIQWPLIFNTKYLVIPEPFQWHITKNSHNIVRIPFKTLLSLQTKLKKIGRVDLENKVSVGIYKWNERPNQNDLDLAQALLVKSLPTYSIPTVLKTQFPYFQPAPGGQKLIWFRLGTQTEPSVIWLPARTAVQLKPVDPKCQLMSGLPLDQKLRNGSYQINPFNVDVSLSIFRLESEDLSCDYEITWG